MGDDHIRRSIISSRAIRIDYSPPSRRFSSLPCKKSQYKERLQIGIFKQALTGRVIASSRRNCSPRSRMYYLENGSSFMFQFQIPVCQQTFQNAVLSVGGMAPPRYSEITWS